MQQGNFRNDRQPWMEYGACTEKIRALKIVERNIAAITRPARIVNENVASSGKYASHAALQAGAKIAAAQSAILSESKAIMHFDGGRIGPLA
ncbi:Hypothetical protein HEAR1754 [Herminiimonas arsenicoxydans]|uniref:Uncharacterized protein n=1 Tax=Herminiimonas arsenicoxydans TaxID=204773 RepID=A4G5X3_HERAR|nr:Hypothetical protein HEAR1754 [Herminiimonas arsenicoxydans]